MLRVSVFRWIIIYHSWVHWWLPPQVGTLFLAEIVILKCGWNLCPSHTLMTLDHGVESLTNSAVVHLTAVETAIIFKSWWLWLSEAYWGEYTGVQVPFLTHTSKRWRPLVVDSTLRWLKRLAYEVELELQVHAVSAARQTWNSLKMLALLMTTHPCLARMDCIKVLTASTCFSQDFF